MKLSTSLICLLLLPLITGQSSTGVAPPTESPGTTPEVPPVGAPEPPPDPAVVPTPDPVVVPAPDPVVVPTPDPAVVPTPDPVVKPTPDPIVDPPAPILLACPQAEGNTLIVSTETSCSETAPCVGEGTVCCNYNSLGQNVCVRVTTKTTPPDTNNNTTVTGPSSIDSATPVSPPSSPSPPMSISTTTTSDNPTTASSTDDNTESTTATPSPARQGISTSATPTPSREPPTIIVDGFSVIPATTEAIVQTVGGVTLTSVSAGVTAISVSGGRLTTSFTVRPARTLARAQGTSSATGGERKVGGDVGWGITVALTLIPFMVGLVWL